jgi:hypothetical protein
MEWEFSSLRKPDYSFTPLDIFISSAVSAGAAAISYIVYPWTGAIVPLLVFVMFLVIILFNMQGSRRKLNFIKIFPSGLHYSGKDADFHALWEDIYALKLNLSKKDKELTVVTLNGDFTYTENLEGWDQLMKEITRRSNLKPRHDISGLHPEMEIYER